MLTSSDNSFLYPSSITKSEAIFRIGDMSYASAKIRRNSLETELGDGFKVKLMGTLVELSEFVPTHFVVAYNNCIKEFHLTVLSDEIKRIKGNSK